MGAIELGPSTATPSVQGCTDGPITAEPYAANAGRMQAADDLTLAALASFDGEEHKHLTRCGWRSFDQSVTRDKT